ncbi:MAG: flagellar export protein FliJ [Lachnospiraceae bacterium]|nr:flagellar export protein FliJ [Lachnospiraceae bacterium]
MARFRYKMQSILDIKEKLETKAKQDFAAANKRLQEEIEKMEQLKARKEQYLEEGVLLRSEMLDIQKMKENKMAVLKMDEYIQQQALQIQKASKAVEAARAALQEVMKERKAHEKLKENAFQDFLKEEQANENKEIDQLTTYTHGQKLMEENAPKNG